MDFDGQAGGLRMQRQLRPDDPFQTDQNHPDTEFFRRPNRAFYFGFGGMIAPHGIDRDR